MRENYRKSIASLNKLSQFTTMNVIDGQAVIIIYASLIFYSLTIDNILNIIVLLILAGVAISMLSGENGILRNAANSKTETELKSGEEEVKLAAMTALTVGGKIEGEKAFEELNKELSKIKGYVKEGDITALPDTVTIGQRVYTINRDGTIRVATEIDKLPTIQAGDYAEEKSKYIDDNKQVAVIPEGFTVSKVKTATVDETTIKSGLVIYKGDLSDTEDMTTCKTTNDQFVWIPVDDPSTMYGTKENGEYYGKLYEFNSNGTTTHLNWYEEIEGTDAQLTEAQTIYDAYKTEVEALVALANENEATKSVILEAGGILEVDELMKLFMERRPSSKEELKDYLYVLGHREPAALSDHTDGDLVFGNPTKGIELLKSIVGLSKESEEDKGIYVQWEEQLKNEFKEMIESVEANKGFYVGRYETSLSEAGNVQVKSGEKAATAENSEGNANTWYGLYQRQKEYSEKNSLTNIVGSTMIWGSQYDQMMIWMQKNNINVTGKIGDDRNLGTENVVGTTGTTEKDKINNIYDLYGNGYEWTLEAGNANNRVLRGGIYYGSGSPSYRNVDYSPYYTYSDFSSRSALYVK